MVPSKTYKGVKQNDRRAIHNTKAIQRGSGRSYEGPRRELEILLQLRKGTRGMLDI